MDDIINSTHPAVFINKDPKTSGMYFKADYKWFRFPGDEIELNDCGWAKTLIAYGDKWNQYQVNEPPPIQTDVIETYETSTDKIHYTSNGIPYKVVDLTNNDEYRFVAVIKFRWGVYHRFSESIRAGIDNIHNGKTPHTSDGCVCKNIYHIRKIVRCFVETPNYVDFPPEKDCLYFRYLIRTNALSLERLDGKPIFNQKLIGRDVIERRNDIESTYAARQLTSLPEEDYTIYSVSSDRRPSSSGSEFDDSDHSYSDFDSDTDEFIVLSNTESDEYSDYDDSDDSDFF